MYGVTPAVRSAWAALFASAAERASQPLTVIEHSPPVPLEDLWGRGDLGLAFMCGYPFATGGWPVRPVAAPVPCQQPVHRRPAYATHFVVRAGRHFATLSETFGGRIGWTLEHSQSGFQAVRHHLLRYRQDGRRHLFAASVGPLMTPRGVIAALLADEIDVGPLDSYFHDLLAAHEPDTAARLAIVETTVPTPMPLLVASARTDGAIVARLRAALAALAADASGRALLAPLRLEGFAPVEPGDYAVLADMAREADAAGYPAPA